MTVTFAVAQSNNPCCLQDYATRSVEANMRKRAVQLRELLTKLGPSFVKVGQALSSRPDLLPKPYLEVCTALHAFQSPCIFLT